MNQVLCTFVACAIPALWSGSLAAAEASVPTGLRNCAAIASDAERLACYDREMARFAAAPEHVATPAATPAAQSTAAPAAAAPIVAAPAETAVAAAPLTPEQRFGLSPGQVEAKYSQKSAEEPLQEISGKVTTVRSLTNNRVLVELDNGQAWRQVDTEVTVRIQPGDSVTIKREFLGSYWLKVNGHAARFKRVR